MKEPEGVARLGLAAAGWHFIAIWLVVGVHCLLVSWPLYYSDFVLEYPYLVGDGPDVILNGLFIAGETVPYSGRPPLLPLLVALLESLSALSWFPFVQQALLHLWIGLFAIFAARRWGRQISWIAALLLLTNDAWLQISTRISPGMWGSALLVTASALLVTGRSHGAFVAAGTLAGLGYAAHQLPLLFLAPVIAVAPLLSRKAGTSAVFVTLTAFLPWPVAWLLFRLFYLGTAGDVEIRHWSLLRPHFDAWSIDLVFTLSLLGLPLAVLAAVGFVALLRRGRTCLEGRFVLVMVLAITTFFTFLYDYHAKRFSIYLYPWLLFLALDALARVRRPRLKVSLALLACLTAAWPHSLREGRSSRIPIVPGVDLLLERAIEPNASSRLARPLAASLELVPWRAWERSIHPEIRAARRRELPTIAVDAELLVGVERGFVLLEAGRGQRRVTARRAALLLRLPFTVRDDAFERRLDSVRWTEVGRADNLVVLRGDADDLERPVVAAVPVGHVELLRKLRRR